ncbi:hypothetical protein Tco_0688011 [Tanacetum coccineum]
MIMINQNCKTSFAKPEYLKKARIANPGLYDIGCYNDNLALMLSPDSDELIRLAQESRSKLSDLIKPFDYGKLNNLYDLFVPQREKTAEQKYFSNSPKEYYTPIKDPHTNEVVIKRPILLETRLNESLPLSKKCKSFEQFDFIKQDVQSFHNGLRCCFEIINDKYWNIPVSPQMQVVIEQKLHPTGKHLSKVVSDFHRALTHEMVEDLK